MAGESPCLTCISVERPGECVNKNCGDWRKWFMQRWNEMRTAPLQKLKALDHTTLSTDDYIVVGGHKYYHPDTVRKRMENGGNEDE